jgi:hypothetical protein
MIDPAGRLRSWAVPLAPFLFSLVLSLSTMGSTVFWQDSGFYLTGIHEMSVPASHGFVLYLLLAKLWTLVVAPLAGFTRSVHLFSAFCAAGAAAVLALAARDFLKRLAPDRPAVGPAISAALVAAGGYCFWNSAILAKPYALYYLTLSVLLWILVRAERRIDFALLAVVLGLAWAAHPSAAMLVPALLAYAWARRDKVRELRATGFAAIIVVAAVAAFAPSFITLPILARRDSLCSFGDPRTPGEVWSHLRGSNYTDFKGAWGFDLARVGLAARFIWEEFLGLGLIVLGLGIWRLAKERRGLLLLIATWSAPMLLLPLVFIGEGMFDQWFVAAYLPLALCTAAGFAWIAERVRVLTPGLLAAAVAWMIFANFSDLNNRGYEDAETYGRLLLDGVERGGILVTTTDDATVIPMYLQKVRDVRTDVRLIHGEYLGTDWYDARVERQLGLGRPKTEEIAARTNPQLLGVTAFANANVAPGRPVYSERPPDPNGLRPGLVRVASGVLWKTAVADEAVAKTAAPAVDVAAVALHRRRARGIYMRHLPTGMVALYEPYEDRLIDLVVQAKLRETQPLLASNPHAALTVYDQARSIDGALQVDPSFQYDYGLALYLNDRPAAAMDVFERVLTLEPSPARATLAHFYLGELFRAANRRDEAKKHYDQALQVGGADPAMMMKIRVRAEQP